MNLRQAAEALLNHWEAGEYKNCTGDMAGHIRVLREAAAQPEWVGLTKEDFYKKDDETVFVLGMKFAEARLKEKNA